MAHVVLVHGLWVDGASWAGVARELLDHQHTVTVVHLPLRSLTDDVAVVRRALAQQDGPTVLVGHSYGGAVISAASHDADNVRALVYVAALVTREGEAVGQVLDQFAPSEGLSAVVSDAHGYLTLDRARFPALFAADLPIRHTEVMAVSQAPAADACLSEPCGPVGWRERPSWYVLCTQDRTLTPESQKAMADHLAATVISVDASHAVAASQPHVVVDAIERAAASFPA